MLSGPPVPARPLPRLSEEFTRLAELCAGETVTFRSLLGEMRPRDQALLTLVLSAAFLHPIPMPGISTLCGLAIMAVGARMAMGKPPWLPARWRDRPLPAAFFRAVFRVFARVLKPMERFTRPRGRFLAAHPATRRVNGGLLAFVGLLIIVPLPPPTNFPPAFAGFFLSVGVLEDDLAVLGLGWVFVALNVLFFGAIAVFGYDGIVAAWNHLRAG